MVELTDDQLRTLYRRLSADDRRLLRLAFTRDLRQDLDAFAIAFARRRVRILAEVIAEQDGDDHE